MAQCSGCASIWGFEDDVLRSADAGADGASGDATADGTALDGNADQTVPLDAMSDAPTEAPTETGEEPMDGPAGDAAVDAEDAPFDGSAETSSPDAGSDADACGTVEICNNNIDDNCDGLVDCADPQCFAGFACIPAPTVGWTGPVELWEGVVPGVPPTCAGAFPSDVYDGNATPTQPPDSCSACACSSASGGACGAATVSFFDDSSCTMTCPDAGATSAQLPVGACVNLTSYTSTCATPSMTISAPAPSGGSCSPSGGAASTTPWAWTQLARVCGVPTPTVPGGCTAPMVCAPRPAAQFDATVCVVLGGAQSCPAAFPSKKTYYGSASDDRTCTACGCGAPSGASCTGTVKEYSGPSCNGSASTLGAPSACTPLSGKSEELTTATPSGGSCAPSGGQPTGSIDPTSPTTVCCAP